MTKIRDRFFAAADEEMAQQGWRCTEQPPHQLLPVRGRYVRSGDGEMVLVAQLLLDESDVALREVSVSALAVAEARIGVTSPATERLLAALGARWVNATLDEDAGLVAHGKQTRTAISSEADVGRVVLELVRTLEASAPTFGSRYPDLDAFIRGHEVEGDEDCFNGEVFAASLAALGRGDEARATLREYQSQYGDPDYDAFAQRLEEFVLSGREAPAPNASLFEPGAGSRLDPSASSVLASPSGPGAEGQYARSHRGIGHWLRDLVGAIRRGGIGALPPSQADWRQTDVLSSAQVPLNAAYVSAETRIGEAAFISVKLEPVGAGGQPTEAEVLIDGQLIGRVGPLANIPPPATALGRVMPAQGGGYQLDVQLPRRGATS